MKKLSKIAVTGGTDALRHAALRRLCELCAGLGYAFFPVAAVQGVQRQRLLRQLERERDTERIALTSAGEKALVVCDGGAFDCAAFMTDPELAEAMRLADTDTVRLWDNYDAVFILRAAACAGSEPDVRLVSAWVGHPHLRLIGAELPAEKRLDRLAAEVLSFLGEPQPLEIERKYLIRYPGIGRLAKSPLCRGVDIVQTYLAAPSGGEIRVRRRGLGGRYVYYKTEKRRVSDTKRVEIEERISEDEYRALLESADPERRSICKTRYCLVFENRYFELDVYPFWDDRAIVEIELCDENESVSLPPQLEVIRDVTADGAYKNSALAKKIPACGT